MVSNALYSEPIPTYQSNAPKIATISTTWRRILTIRRKLGDFCFCSRGISEVAKVHEHLL